MKKILITFLSILMFAGCSSIKQPNTVVQPLDYSDEDIKSIEIQKIKDLQKNECTLALFRSYFLDNQELKDECANIVKEYLDKSIQDKNYYEAFRLYKSLEAVNYHDEKLFTKIKNLISNDVPGFTVDKSKLPKTINDCINASVTIWVDKGVKVENGKGMQDVVLGSGFFIDKRGYIITNHHVIESMVNPKYEGYCRIYVKLLSDTENKIPAKVIGYDSVLDLALLKVEIEPNFVFELGSSNDLSVGDKISAIGAPVGLEGTLTSGIVSAKDRKLTTLTSVFQIDAAVNSGNSGGPLIDENKRVQAIVFAGLLQFQGLNFAIPVEYLKQILPLLYKGNQVEHNWLGCYGHTYKENKKEDGIELYYVMPDSSAQFSKLTEDCIIKEIDGVKINSLDKLHLFLMSYENKTILKCKYLDPEGNLQNTIIYLDKRPKYPVKEFFDSDFMADSFLPLFGMKLQNASTINRNSYTISKIIKGSNADELNLSVLDPIEIQKIQFDYQNGYFISQVYVKRKSKGFLDCSMVIGCSLDSFNYF